MASLEEIAASFRGVDDELRVQLLLDFARKLPAIPERLEAEAESHRVHECMTPLWLWVEKRDDGTRRLFIKVAEEAPTIRGIAGVLVEALDGAVSEAFEAVPDDLIGALGLQDILRMNRVVGIAALVGRIRKASRDA